MKFLKRSIPVFLAVMLAVMCMIAPAFAASTTGSGYLFNQTSFEVYPDERVAYFNDVDSFTPEMGVIYLITLNGETYSVEPVLSVYDNDVGAVIWEFSLGEYTFAFGMEGTCLYGPIEDKEYTITVERYVTFSDRLGNLLDDSGEVVTSIVSWVPKVARLVMNEPVLLIGFTIGLATLAFGIFKALKR